MLVDDIDSKELNQLKVDLENLSSVLKIKEASIVAL